MLTNEIIELYKEFNFRLNIPHPTLFELCILLDLFPIGYVFKMLQMLPLLIIPFSSFLFVLLH